MLSVARSASRHKCVTLGSRLLRAARRASSGRLRPACTSVWKRSAVSREAALRSVAAVISVESAPRVVSLKGVRSEDGRRRKGPGSDGRVLRIHHRIYCIQYSHVHRKYSLSWCVLAPSGIGCCMRGGSLIGSRCASCCM